MTRVLLRPGVRIPPCPPSRRAVLLALAAPLLGAALTGCVSRKLFLITDPPGARVTIDGRVVGTTPYEEGFLSYGTRRVELELDGHARRVESVDVALPWWQVFPLDIVTDLLVPWTIEDHRVFAFTLQPVDREAAGWDEAHAARDRMRALERQLHAAKPADPAAGADAADGGG